MSKMKQIKLAPQTQQCSETNLSSFLKVERSEEELDLYSMEGITERDVILIRLVKTIYPMANSKKVIGIVLEFEPLLEIEPTERLYHSFVQSVHRHTGEYDTHPSEIIQLWFGTGKSLHYSHQQHTEVSALPASPRPALPD